MKNIAENLVLNTVNNFEHNLSGQQTRLELLTAKFTPVEAAKDLFLGVYPNPVTSNYQLNFMTTADQAASIAIFDSNGKWILVE